MRAPQIRATAPQATPYATIHRFPSDRRAASYPTLPLPAGKAPSSYSNLLFFFASPIIREYGINDRDVVVIILSILIPAALLITRAAPLSFSYKKTDAPFFLPFFSPERRCKYLSLQTEPPPRDANGKRGDIYTSHWQRAYFHLIHCSHQIRPSPTFGPYLSPITITSSPLRLPPTGT